MKRSLATIMLCGLLAWALPASAGIENAGTTAANFLSVGQGASVLGMGGATLGFGADLNTAYWNTASLTRLNATQIVFSHASLDQENNQEWAAIGGRWGSQRFWSATGLYQGNGTFDGRDALGNSTGSFSASSMALGLNVAQTFSSNVSVGLGAQFVNETLGDVSGSGITFNAGVQMQRGIWGLGAAAQNMFGQMKYDGAPYRFPGNVGMGVSVSDPARNLRFALDMNFPTAYYSDVRTGVEWRYKEHLALRTGYRKEMGADSGEPLGGPTFGMGAGANGLWFDYGLITGGSGASAEHRIGLTYRPGFNSTVPGIQASDAQKPGTETATAAAVPTEKQSKKSKSSATPADQTLAAEPEMDQAPPRTSSTNAKPAPATSEPAKKAAAPAPSMGPEVKPGVQYVPPVAAGITVGTAAAAKPTTAPSTAAPAPATTAPATTVAKPAATATTATTTNTAAPAPTSVKTATPVTKPVVTPGATAAAGAAVATTGAAATTSSGTKAATGTNYTKTPTTSAAKEVAAPSATKELAATSGTSELAASSNAKEVATPSTKPDEGTGLAELAALTPVTPAETAKPAATPAAPAPAAVAPASETPKPAVVAPVVAAPVKPAPEVAKPAAEVAKPATTGPRPAKVKVGKGESMSDIAAKWGTSAAAIMMENNLVTDKVKPGMELKLPPKK